MSSSSAAGGSDHVALPPFLEKLQLIAKSVDPSIASWSEDGTEFQVHSDRFDSEVISHHFKGSRKTFIRQLHFYSFHKNENLGECWSFSHPNFLRDHPEQIYEIRRKTRTNVNDTVSRHEFERVKSKLDEYRSESEKQIADLRSQVSLLTKLVTDAQLTRQPQPVLFPHFTAPHPHAYSDYSQTYAVPPEYFQQQQPNYQLQFISSSNVNVNSPPQQQLQLPQPNMNMKKRKLMMDKIMSYETPPTQVQHMQEGTGTTEFEECFGKRDSFITNYLPFDDFSVDNNQFQKVFK